MRASTPCRAAGSTTEYRVIATPRSERHGTLSCALYSRPVYGHQPQVDLNAASDSPIYTGRKAEFYLDNLECTLRASDSGSEAEVTRFARAVEELVPNPHE